MDHQTAEQNGCRAIAGNAQREQRNQRASTNGVIGGFRRDYAVWITLAKGFRFFGKAFGLIVGDKRGNISARRRNNPDHGSDQTGAKQIPFMLPQLFR